MQGREHELFEADDARAIEVLLNQIVIVCYFTNKIVFFTLFLSHKNLQLINK